jgi:DNA-binding PadR family transcriptional regulator
VTDAVNSAIDRRLDIVSLRDYDADMPREPRDLLPLKPFIFDVLVVLLDGELHGWGLLRALEQRTQQQVLPGQLYRQLEAMLAEELIEEHASSSRPTRTERVGGAAPKRFFRLTAFGRAVARAEARRLETMVNELRDKRLLPARGRS